MSSPAVQPLLAMLACPVGGNPTQYMIEKAFAHHDLDWRYLTFEVAAANLDDAVRGLRAMGFRGAHCAGPHERAIVPLLDRCTETADLLGAVNFVFRDGPALVGDYTEGKGVLAALRRARDVTGKNVVLCGAGRMARAIAVELAAAGIACLTVVNRTEARADELVAMLAGKYETPCSVALWQGDYGVPPEAEVLIHATSLGHGDEDAVAPLMLDSLRPELLVADVTADPPATRLLREARQRGCATLDGLTMLIERVAVDLQRWTSVDPNRQVLREAAEEFLGL